jgi:hypothetical protein
MGGWLPCSLGVAYSLTTAVGPGEGCSATGVVGGKGARYHLPNARTVLHGGTRAALHVRGRRGGRCVLLAPFAPLARLGWTLPRLPVFGSRTPY